MTTQPARKTRYHGDRVIPAFCATAEVARARSIATFQPSGTPNVYHVAGYPDWKFTANGPGAFTADVPSSTAGGPGRAQYGRLLALFDWHPATDRTGG